MKAKRCKCGAKMLLTVSGHWICAAIRQEIKATVLEFTTSQQNAQEGRQDATQRPIRRGDVSGHGAKNKGNGVKA